MLLSSLPDTWKNFVVAIETRDELPTFVVVKVNMNFYSVGAAAKY